MGSSEVAQVEPTEAGGRTHSSTGERKHAAGSRMETGWTGWTGSSSHLHPAISIFQSSHSHGNLRGNSFLPGAPCALHWANPHPGRRKRMTVTSAPKAFPHLPPISPHLPSLAGHWRSTPALTEVLGLVALPSHPRMNLDTAFRHCMGPYCFFGRNLRFLP